MNQARIDQLLQGQSNIARKVFQAVPIAEAWTAGQIRAELARLGAHNDVRIIEGCLRSLEESGLIKEPGRGMFQRHAVKIALPQPAREEAPTAAAPRVASEPARLSPLDVLINISERVSALTESVKAIKKDIDDAAIMIEQRIAESEAANQQLTQLRQLLKSI